MEPRTKVFGFGDEEPRQRFRMDDPDFGFRLEPVPEKPGVRLAYARDVYLGSITYVAETTRGPGWLVSTSTCQALVPGEDFDAAVAALLHDALVRPERQ